MLRCFPHDLNDFNLLYEIEEYTNDALANAIKFGRQLHEFINIRAQIAVESSLYVDYFRETRAFNHMRKEIRRSDELENEELLRAFQISDWKFDLLYLVPLGE